MGKKAIASKVKPVVKITLDKERTLKLDLNAMVAYEEATGSNLLDGSFLSSGMSAKELRTMLWACLLHEDDTLTEQQVGSWVNPANLVDITSKLDEAFEVSLPKSEGEETGPLEKTPPTG